MWLFPRCCCIIENPDTICPRLHSPFSLFLVTMVFVPKVDSSAFARHWLSTFNPASEALQFRQKINVRYCLDYVGVRHASQNPSYAIAMLLLTVRRRETHSYKLGAMRKRPFPSPHRTISWVPYKRLDCLEFLGSCGNCSAIGCCRRRSTTYQALLLKHF